LPGCFADSLRQKKLAIGIYQNYAHALSKSIFIDHLKLT
jgi:hypothetical protein